MKRPTPYGAAPDREWQPIARQYRKHIDTRTSWRERIGECARSPDFPVAVTCLIVAVVYPFL